MTIPYVLLVYNEAYGIVECLSGPALQRESPQSNTGAARRFKPPTAGGSSLRRQQFEERLRIAERIVQALNEAGHSCGLADKAYSLNGVDLPSRH